MSYADEIAVVRDSLHRTRVGGGPVAVGDAIRIVELVEVLRQRLDALASKVHALEAQRSVYGPVKHEELGWDPVEMDAMLKKIDAEKAELEREGKA